MPQPLRRTSIVRRAVPAVPLALLGVVLAVPAPASARRRRHASVEPPAAEAPAPSPTGEAGAGSPSSEPSLAAPPPSEPALIPAPRAPRHGRCRVSLEAPAPLVGAGEAATLIGHVSCRGTTAPSSEQITIYEREGAAHAAMSQLSSVNSNEDGSFQLSTPALTGKTVFVARAALAGSARVTVRVTPTVTLAGPATSGAVLATRAAHAHGADRLSFSGSVSPAGEGGHVALQIEYLGTGERWHTIARARLDGEGHFSISRGFRAPGELQVRVVSHVKGELVTASEPLSYDIAPAQNPQLTIESSVDPVLSGQTVTISGVAAGATAEPLALLARTRGGSFTAEATTISEAGGAYSFTVTATQSTTYRVRDAQETSAELFEAVRYPLTVLPPSAPAQTGVPLSFTGTVLTAPLGQPVLLERASGGEAAGRFRVVASAGVDGAFSYAIPYSFTRAGSYRMRVSVPPSAGMLASTSEAFTVSVTGAPLETPETATAPEAPSGADEQP